jgi:hypothetical protein
MNKKIITILLLTAVSPIVVFAGGLKELLTSFGYLVDLAVPVVFALSLTYFFWGMVQFISHSGDQKFREEGKNKMLWGVIALFVMFSVYGIIKFIGQNLGITQGGKLL